MKISWQRSPLVASSEPNGDWGRGSVISMFSSFSWKTHLVNLFLRYQGYFDGSEGKKESSGTHLQSKYTKYFIPERQRYRQQASVVSFAASTTVIFIHQQNCDGNFHLEKTEQWWKLSSRENRTVMETFISRKQLPMVQCFLPLVKTSDLFSVGWKFILCSSECFSALELYAKGALCGSTKK